MPHPDETTVSGTLPDGAVDGRALALLWVHHHDQPRLTRVEEKLVIGRDAACDLVIDSPRVSRKHLELRRVGPLLVAEDLQSRNGTYLDGVPLAQAPLKDGQFLRLGDALAKVIQLQKDSEFAFGEITRGIWGGGRLRRALEVVPRVAPSVLSAVIEGESGCGKEGVARAIHEQSGRTGEFVAVDCASIPEQLIESHLFGHRKGAFTGADRNRPGLLEAANDGTLFFDEIIELPQGAQAKLLRALQEGEVLPVGATRPVKVDARVVVAAQRPLTQCVEAGDFRADLYARLCGVVIELPPLRERREDVPLLLRHFLREQLGDTIPLCRGRVLEALCLHGWPLNVRELKTLANRLGVLYGTEPEVLLEHLPRELREPPRAQDEVADAETAEAVDQLLVELAQTNGNVVQASSNLGISRSRAYRLIAAHCIDVDRFRRRGTK